MMKNKYHFTQVYHKWQSHDIWFLRYEVQQTEFFVILGHFLPFYPPTAWKVKISKNEKKPGDMIILHKCAKNHDHRQYCSWDMVIFVIFHFVLYFSLFPSLFPLQISSVNSHMINMRYSTVSAGLETQQSTPVLLVLVFAYSTYCFYSCKYCFYSCKYCFYSFKQTAT